LTTFWRRFWVVEVVSSDYADGKATKRLAGDVMMAYLSWLGRALSVQSLVLPKVAKKENVFGVFKATASVTYQTGRGRLAK